MTTITNNKLPEWRTALDKCVENYQSTRAWYEENRDSPAALDDMERAEDQLANFVRKCGFSIVLGLLDEMDELQELRRNYLALRGEIEGVRSQLYEAENQANEYASELQERRKADSAEPDYIRYDCGCCGWQTINDWRDNDACPKCNHKPMGKTELYTAPPASERERIRREHAEWSDAMFGDISPIGPLKHLSKESLETAAEPDDLSEWADMQFLLWDAQRRAGITDEQITRALTEKLAINKARQWPELKDGEPRLHIKEQPAPVIPAAWYDIMSERLRQQSVEGWTPEHDDAYDGGELAGAAACYARHASARVWIYAENPAAYQDEDVPGDWPWAEEWWKPTSPYRDLEKAGTLILAEMERINRVTGAGEGGAVVGEVSRG
ncbi:DUF550 domain-containing protein [Salmonella enterica]|nr:DUF550 domain-containing protein [Salmonella enterica]